MSKTRATKPKLKLVVDNVILFNDRAKIWAEGLEIIADRVKIKQEIARLNSIDKQLTVKLKEREDKLTQLMRGKTNVIRPRKQTKGDRNFR